MATPTTPPSRRVTGDTERPSILSRLSLSPSKRGSKTKSAISNPMSTMSLQEPIAGPSYESRSGKTNQTSSLSPSRQLQEYSHGGLPDQAHLDPTRYMGSADRPQLAHSAEPRRPRYQTTGLSSISSPESAQPPSGYTPSQNGGRSSHLGHSPSTSPPRSRQPIYPALASPPRVRHAQAASPPTSTHQWNTASYTPPRTPGGLTIDTSVAPSPPRRKSSPRVHTSGSSISPVSQRTTMQIIATSNGHHDKLAASDKTGQLYDKHGRPLMSARRSASSSSRTITRAHPVVYSTLSSPNTSQDSRRTQRTVDAEGTGLTEASAYAKAVASNQAYPKPTLPPMRTNSTGTLSPATDASGVSRPLPRPPNSTSDPPHPPPNGAQLPKIPKANSQKSLGRIAQSGASPRKTSGTPRRESAINFDFPRSPTIPALVDPRNAGHRPTEMPQSGCDSMLQTPLRATTSTSPSKPSSDGAKAVNGSELRRPRGKLSIDYLLSHPAIQSSLLSSISINAFLSLTGSFESTRRQFTGESVGRWVLREWGVQTPLHIGTRWPNLTVWEGFLESLLHDPATYSTYPARWHSLLRHLALSHSLVVLYLRNLPPTSYPNHSLLPFEDEGASSAIIPFSSSSTSLASLGQPRSRVGSVAGSETGSVVLGNKPPRRERVIEIVMPEPLAAQPPEATVMPEIPKPVRRRGSISSLASAASFSFGRRRSNSVAVDARPLPQFNGISLAEPSASMPPGKGSLPPVSYPSAKRYAFKNGNEQNSRSRQSSMGHRPGSVFSMQTSPSVASYAPRMSQTFELRAPHMPNHQAPLVAPPPIGVRPRSSFGSADSIRRSERDQNSPGPGRRTAFPGVQTARSEPAFDRPMPYIPGRAPVLRVFVPLSESVRRWPSAEGAVAAIEELDKCGALKRMQLGDLIVNTAIRMPRTTEHVLLFVPFVRHQLVPLQYVYNATGHLPAYVDAFALPPSYYYPFLPAPQIVHLNLAPYRDQGLRSMRLASDRRDVTIASGAKIAAKRFLYVAGVEIRGHDKAAAEWQGMVSLEAEGTAEGKADLEARFGQGGGQDGLLAPWEIVKEKSMGGTVWLRLVKEKAV